MGQPVGMELFPDPSTRIMVFLLMEHSMFAFKFVIHGLIPDESSRVMNARLRRDYLSSILVDNADEYMEEDQAFIISHDGHSQGDYEKMMEKYNCKESQICLDNQTPEL